MLGQRLVKINLQLLLISLFLIVGKSVKSQDIVFTQFFAMPQYVNPAWAGRSASPTVYLNFRDQWPAIAQAYVSYSAAYDQYFKGIHGGVGLLLLSDRAGNGMYQSNAVYGNYAYNIQLSDQFAVKGGIQVGIVQKFLDFSKIFFLDQIDPVTGYYNANNQLNPSLESSTFQPSSLYVDFAAGLLVHSSKLYAGISVKHLNRPEEHFSNNQSSRLPMRYTAQIGAKLPLDGSTGNVTFSPNILYTQQFLFKQINGGFSFRLSKIIAGAWFRHNFSNPDALIFLAGIEYGIISTGYTYDLSLSNLKAYSGGAHEISIILNFDKLPGAGRPKAGDYLQCPEMF